MHTPTEPTQLRQASLNKREVALERVSVIGFLIAEKPRGMSAETVTELRRDQILMVSVLTRRSTRAKLNNN